MEDLIFWADKLFCLFIAWGGYEVLKISHNLEKLPPMAWHGIRLIFISAMLAVCSALTIKLFPFMVEWAHHFSGLGINLGLCVVLYAHYLMFKKIHK